MCITAEINKCFFSFVVTLEFRLTNSGNFGDFDLEKKIILCYFALRMGPSIVPKNAPSASLVVMLNLDVHFTPIYQSIIMYHVVVFHLSC